MVPAAQKRQLVEWRGPAPIGRDGYRAGVQQRQRHDGMYESRALTPCPAGDGCWVQCRVSTALILALEACLIGLHIRAGIWCAAAAQSYHAADAAPLGPALHHTPAAAHQLEMSTLDPSFSDTALGLAERPAGETVICCTPLHLLGVQQRRREGTSKMTVSPPAA